MITGDARILAAAIPDGSVDCLFTDPVYEKVADYEWLGAEAMRVLRPDTACLVWCKTTNLDECKKALTAAGLRYRYTLYYACSAKGAKPMDGGIFPWVTPCLFLSKGKRTAEPHITDYYFSPYSAAAHSFQWAKGGGVVEKWLNAFSRPGDVVFDPFTGHGAVPIACKRLDRHFIAFEIEPERAAEARRLIDLTPAFLPFTAEQGELTF